MEQGHSQEFITAPPAILKFEPSLTSLQSNLEVWIRNAFAAPDMASRLGLLCQQLEVATLLGMISLPDRFRVALPDRYARRLIYEDSATGISVASTACTVSSLNEFCVAESGAVVRNRANSASIVSREKSRVHTRK